MAEEESLQLEVKEPAKRPKWLMVAIIAGAGVLLAAIVAGVVILLSSGDDRQGAEQVEISTPLTPGDALYVGMPRPFLFNLPGEKRSYLVQIKVQVQVRGFGDQEIAKKHIPLIEDSLLSTFSAADAKQLSTREGKEELRTQALINVQTTLQGITGKPVVERVLFTGFVMQ
ncbi:flagellar basal body-associated protein FliL [Ferrimonas sediminicola]|uniref:Flagellar protein FliL n=1 Tax=Ferrimonas sediminicola TaxID=2569538 RepID=A0A4U1BA08_9GAMM|nr:flagellar basal body-associated protein FliL [Ferrimonas sediminicola]TKB47236.1 flagellar basal body-associated protein FliL [Ferrimonas sediminicola]